MEKIKEKKPNKVLLRLKRLFNNIKTTEWAGPKCILKGTGGVVLFTGFFVILFTLVDLVGTFISIIVGG